MNKKVLALKNLLCYHNKACDSRQNKDCYKEVRQMSRKCEVYGKGQTSGNTVSHSNIHTKRKWNANIQTVRINDNGRVRKASVCTSCLRSGKVNRAV